MPTGAQRSGGISLSSATVVVRREPLRREQAQDRLFNTLPSIWWLHCTSLRSVPFHHRRGQATAATANVLHAGLVFLAEVYREGATSTSGSMPVLAGETAFEAVVAKAGEIDRAVTVV